MVGMLPWLAMAFSSGRLQPPPPEALTVLRNFGGGSGLLAYAFLQQSNRITPFLSSEPAAEVVAAAQPRVEPAKTAQSAWAALFPS